MIRIVTLCFLVASVYGSLRYGHHGHGYGHGYGHRYGHGYGYDYKPTVKVVKVEKVEKPTPYEFSYDIKNDYHDSFGRSESGDGYGNKQGSYQIQLANGLRRWVSYVADEGGFRAKVNTNEPGTDSQDPADVHITADPVEIKAAPKKIVKKILVAPSYHHGYAPIHRHPRRYY